MTARVLQGPLIGYHFSVAMMHKRRVTSILPKSITYLEKAEIDLSPYWDKKIHSARLLAACSKLTIYEPIEFIVATPLELPSLTGEKVELSIRVKKNDRLDTHQVDLDKLKLNWDSIFPLLDVRRNDSATAVPPSPAQLGVIPAYRHPSKSTVIDPRTPNSNMFVRWATSPTGEVMYNQIVEAVDSRGVIWTLSHKSSGSWSLDSVHIYLKMEELTGPRVSLNLQMSLTTTAGKSIPLGVETDTIFNIDDDLINPPRTVVIYNASHLSEFTALYSVPAAPTQGAPVTATPPPSGIWAIDITGTALVPAHEACHRTEYVNDTVYPISLRFTQNDAAAGSALLKSANTKEPFVLFSNESLSVNALKVNDSSFRIISFLYKM